MVEEMGVAWRSDDLSGDWRCGLALKAIVGLS